MNDMSGLPSPLFDSSALAPRRFLAVGGGFLLVLFFMQFATGSPADAQRPDGDATRSRVADPAAVVEMTNKLTFAPTTVTIEVGETVRWKNTSVIVHTVTADPEEATIDGSVQLPEGAEPFDSGNMDTQATFEHTFTTPGTYTYFCIPHEVTKMRGTIVVEPAS